MLFHSYIFVFLFFPALILCYYLLNRINFKIGTIFISLASMAFYAYGGIASVPLLVGSMIINFTTTKLFSVVHRTKLKKVILVGSIILNLAILVYYKYSGFILNNFNHVFGTGFTINNLILPLAISFFTFQQIAYLVDSYRNEIENKSFIDYSLLILYFPKLIAGPIVSPNDLLNQFKDTSRKKINWENLSKGFYLFVLGMAKKILIADIFGKAVDAGFSDIAALNTIDAILVMLSYTVQIYFDFSGYSDMAIGLSKMLNIDLPINFHSPYKALTITDFWSRWHITLTGFFTKYIYFPLGGSRKGKVRTYANTLIVFLISGIWHGANWTFILWGLLHGVFMCTTKLFEKAFNQFHPVFNWILTSGFINLTWVLFRANSISDAKLFFSRIADLDFGYVRYEISEAFEIIELKMLFLKIFNGAISPIVWIVLYFLLAFILILGVKNAKELTENFKPSFVKCFVTAILFVLCVFSFSGMNTFLYANF